ncbi:hypothetical protein MNBD_PLANCTO03-2141 [hydrothermal vent metagenome]|uniref:Uncharacterized protein n=1 Tax=hydrothermal vent metagenome TaxID=652676 RepID=A0A3B1DJB3_9ZZZZ
MTEVVRSTHQGDSHGGAYLVNLETREASHVLDWNRLDIDWEGRGQGRGLRGIVFYNAHIYIAASDELFVFDQSFNIVRSFRNRYLRHCHEICRAGDTLYLTATSFDSVLEFDLRRERFIRAHLIRYQPRRVRTPMGVREERILRIGRYDPNRTDGPAAADTTHINNITTHRKKLMVSGVRLTSILALDRAGHAEYAPTPEWTHNAQLYRHGVLYNSTAEDAVCFASLAGEVFKRLPIPRYDPAELTKNDLPDDYARQAFARGLIATDEGLIIAGSSPSTVTAWDFDSGEQLATVNFGKDIRNAPHGLAIWPY